MKKKISISLCETTLAAIDRWSGVAKNRSDFIETAVCSCIAKLIRDEQNAKDLAIINRHADRLNAAAADVLAFQVVP
jgi:metal-responsive CopG/Arc/MetJ family transcriptional regulator